MSFVNSAALWLLLLFPLMIVFLIWREQLRKRRLGLMGNLATLQSPSSFPDPARRRWKHILWLFALMMLIIALARPVWGEELRLVETQGVSVMVVLDVSRSMDAQDIKPSRLERAKLDAQELFTHFSGHELGLILFAGEAYVQFPLTVDTISANTFLQSASTESISRQGTNVDAALRLAIERFNLQVSSKRVIVLLTDGENHEGDPLQIAQQAAESDITIYVLGYGTLEGAPVPVYTAEGDFVGDQLGSDGELLVSRLDENILNAIAERTDGFYQRVASGSGEISNLLVEVESFQSTSPRTAMETKPTERLGIFIALAFIALSLEIVLTESKK